MEGGCFVTWASRPNSHHIPRSHLHLARKTSVCQVGFVQLWFFYRYFGVFKSSQMNHPSFTGSVLWRKHRNSFNAEDTFHRKFRNEALRMERRSSTTQSQCRRCRTLCHPPRFCFDRIWHERKDPPVDWQISSTVSCFQSCWSWHIVTSCTSLTVINLTHVFDFDVLRVGPLQKPAI